MVSGCHGIIKTIIPNNHIFQTVKKALYKPKNLEVAVKMTLAKAMSEDDFILEATNMK